MPRTSMELSRFEVWMPIYYEYLHSVRDGEIDELGHANNTAYFQWMQSAAIAHSSEQGWPMERYREKGWAWLVRRHEIEYRRPVLSGAEVRIRTWVADMNRFTSLRKFEMYCGQLLMARAETNWAFVDLQNGRLRAIPEEVAAAFQLPEPPSPINEESSGGAEQVSGGL